MTFRRLDNIINAAVMTEELGLDVFRVGQHHAVMHHQFCQFNMDVLAR